MEPISGICKRPILAWTHRARGGPWRCSRILTFQIQTKQLQDEPLHWHNTRFSLFSCERRAVRVRVVLNATPRRRRECTLGRGVLDGGDGLSRRVTRVSAGWEGAAAALALCKKLALVSRVPLQFTRVSSTEKASLATKESEKESC